MLRRTASAVLALLLLPATLHAFDHHHHFDDDHRGGGGGCDASSASSTPTSAEPTTPAVTTPSTSVHHVFITATKYSGAVGSVASADQYCQESASAAGLEGTYQAWISDRTVNAIDRTVDVGPWYSTADVLAFQNKDILTVSSQAPLLDENGMSLSTSTLWTGSDERGVATGLDCAGWTDATSVATATVGDGRAQDLAWGSASVQTCDGSASLLCLQQ